jgi:hypothetical protein
MSLPVSVLDLTPIPAGFGPSDAVRNTIELARRADEHGFTRYWLAAHHNGSGVACPAPELMVITHIHSHEARKRSYALLREALA